jgi:hypothetical protein
MIYSIHDNRIDRVSLTSDASRPFVVLETAS